MGDYSGIIKTGISLLVLVVLWMVCVFVWLIPYTHDKLGKKTIQTINEKTIAQLQHSNQTLIEKNVAAEQTLDQLAQGIAADLQTVQIKLIKTAQDNRLVSLLTETTPINDNNQAYQSGIIRYQLTGNYPNYWRFKTAIGQLNAAYQTESEQLHINDQGQLLIEGELRVLVGQ